MRCWPSLLLLALSSCAPDAEQSSCQRDPPLDYNDFGRGFLERHCTGCHSSLLAEGHRADAPVGVDLDSYADAVQWADRIYIRSVGEDASMPPGGGPTDQEKALLAEWLTCDLGVEP